MKLQRLFYLASVLCIMASCAKEPVFEPEVTDPDLIPLNISGSIDQVPTRATAQGFVDGDGVGLYAVNYLENNTIAGTLAATGNQADNVKYVFDETNYKWVPVKPVYYKDINTHVDLYLYYPFEGSISDVNAANFEVKKDQSTAATATELSGYEASDWMWGKAEDVTPSQSSVPISLKHKLSAIKVTLNEGTGWDTDEFASVSKGVIVTNTTRKATLNYATGEVAAIGEPQLDGIVMCPQTDGTFRAVVIPQTVAAGTSLFSITVNGVSYSFTQNNAVTYQQGKMLNATININKKTPTGDYELELAESVIVPWMEDLNTHGGEARQYYVVNVETPGTLGDVIAADGKNPAKIRNLKVTGTVNENDFYFMRDNMDILEAVNMKECEPIVHYHNTQYNDLYLDYWTLLYGEPTKSGNTYVWDVDVHMIPDNAFSDKKSLTKFVFPEGITSIGYGAFVRTNLSGALILPEGLSGIDGYAFALSLISSVSFPSTLTIIGENAFDRCLSLSGELLFPNNLKYISHYAFYSCKGLSGGHLHLPNDLEVLGAGAFHNLGSMIGDLVIPPKITRLRGGTFESTSFTGTLDLSNVQEIGGSDFDGSGFSGELILPEGILEIPSRSFFYCGFSSISFPSTLKRIEENAFNGNYSVIEPLVLPEGVIFIGDFAFGGCRYIPSLEFPSTLQSIGMGAFGDDYNVSSIVCNAIEPPSVGASAFGGIAKDNFTVEVPDESVVRYQAEKGWDDFKRIAAHYDFSLSRKQMRALNDSRSQTYVLRAPAGFNWSVQSKPEWVTVSPSSGIGKTDVTVTIAEMTSSEVGTFEVNEGSFNNPSYVNYEGRSGDLVFKLNDNGYSCSMRVEQYDYEHQDGFAQQLYASTIGAGINIVLTGDGYDARDIASGKFAEDALSGYGHLFDVEPYKTYKPYFNVYSVIALSDESGIGTVNTIVDTKFGSTLTQNRILLQSQNEVFAWAKKANPGMDLTKSLVILLQNTSTYEGITYMYGDGSALACCPVSTQAYPYDFRGIIQHEAGGHAFGKLGDEYIYHNAFIQNCICLDGCEHPQGDDDLSTHYGNMKALGWYKNLSMTSDAKRVPWAHLIYNPQYSNYVDMFEGGYMHSRGMYRSEATSCMNNNIPYFSAISRQAIVERIMECAGRTFSLEDFYANDSREFGPHTRSGGKYSIDLNFGVDPHLNHATGHGPVLVGEHPNVK